MKYTDPTGMYWVNFSDEEFANSLSGAMSDKLKDQQKSADKMYAQYKKEMGKGNKEGEG